MTIRNRIKFYFACRALQRLRDTQKEREFARRSRASKRGWANRRRKEARV